ncbi:MAG: dihydroxy-acid dehydratase [Actinobacteria bacterium]|nr:dihydroxy-acid dehydratase [Actinomycetota bacterium]
MADPAPTLSSDHPGHDAQRVGTARVLGQDVTRVHEPVWAVIGTLGESQCYLGVQAKVEAIQQALARRITDHDMQVRLVAPAYSLGVSDGQLNGTARMRYSLVSREVVHDTTEVHLRANEVAAAVAVVACDKPPVGTVAALLEHDVPAIVCSDGSIRPGTDPESCERIDIVSAYQASGDPDHERRSRLALSACPGFGSCGGMYTYNTMQTFFAAVGLEPLHMVSPASEDPRRLEQFPDELVGHLETLVDRGIRPRDIVTAPALRNAITVALAMGGSTNMVLHCVEIARAAGIDFWGEVLSQQEFNDLTRCTPVITNLRPYGRWSMVDVDDVGGLQVVVRELLDAGHLDGSTLTCTGESLAEQVRRLDPPRPDGDVVHTVSNPFKPTGGLRLLRGNLAPDGGAVLKTAGIEQGIVDGRFEGVARVFDDEPSLLAALEEQPDSFGDGTMIVLRYGGPRGAPGMPELLEPTSRVTTLCRERGVTIGLLTDARFSGGSVGLVIGHVAPEALLGGPIALVEDGDHITVDLDHNRLDCRELDDATTSSTRADRWEAAVAANGGVHPAAGPVEARVLIRARARAVPALQGGGLLD